MARWRELIGRWEPDPGERTLPVEPLDQDHVIELRDRRIHSLRVQPGPPRMSLEALTSRTRSEHPATRQLIVAMAAAYLPGKRAAAG